MVQIRIFTLFISYFRTFFFILISPKGILACFDVVKSSARHTEQSPLQDCEAMGLRWST